ncbi:hypothetical protein EDB81DRAFT_814689 [Dactylonectria macrodidyma]|uniref:Uncharacterized protein n=2 Tax=Dactylonectria TaxID=1620264 RepID=A0A9P9DHN1_9HYPO|nr:hypothetical protein EDB81DRAFT_814689 [Dactylonectria macrodidyma]
MARYAVASANKSMSSRRLWLKLSSSLEHRNRAANSTTWRLLRSHGRQRFGYVRTVVSTLGLVLPRP